MRRMMPARHCVSACRAIDGGQRLPGPAAAAAAPVCIRWAGQDRTGDHIHGERPRWKLASELPSQRIGGRGPCPLRLAAGCQPERCGCRGAPTAASPTAGPRLFGGPTAPQARRPLELLTWIENSMRAPRAAASLTTCSLGLAGSGPSGRGPARALRVTPPPTTPTTHTHTTPSVH